jgi:hypothetical protein
MRHLLATTLMFLVAGCGADSFPTYSTGKDDQDAAVDGDANTMDGSLDAETDAGDAFPACTCSSDKPVCLGDGTCVECTMDHSKACTGAKPVCGSQNTCVQCTEAHFSACTGTTPACDTQANACVACNTDSHCAESSPACSLPQHTCGKCTEDADCTRFGKVCHEMTGTCVACTVDSEAAQCGDKSCNPATKQCTQTVRKTIQQCDACVADSECLTDHRCIEMFFGLGAARVSLGGRCMKRGVTGCMFPYSGAPINRQSLSGATTESYCGVAEERTSCEAIRKLQQGASCSTGGDQTCGAPGALCRRVNNTDDLCTYTCEASAECPSVFACPTSGNDKYCGKN